MINSIYLFAASCLLDAVLLILYRDKLQLRKIIPILLGIILLTTAYPAVFINSISSDWIRLYIVITQIGISVIMIAAYMAAGWCNDISLDVTHKTACTALALFIEITPACLIYMLSCDILNDMLEDILMFCTLTIFSKLSLSFVYYTFLSNKGKTPKPVRQAAIWVACVTALSASALCLIAACNFTNSYIPSLIVILLIAGGIAIYIIGDFAFAFIKNNAEERIHMQFEQNTIKYNETINDAASRQRLLIHDIKNHLLFIEELSRQGKNEEIYNYVGELVASYKLQDTGNYTSNHTLNIILQRYGTAFKEAGIDFSVNLFSPVLENMTSGDLNTMFCNILDNAFEASKVSDDGYVFLSVVPREGTEFTTIRVVNTCTSDPFNSAGDLLSSKKDHALHGYGLKSVRRVAEKYSGHMELYYKGDEHEFHTLILLKNA